MSRPCHDCHALLVTCMDWRLHPQVEDHFSAMLDGPFDLVAVGGGSKSFAEHDESGVGAYLLGCVDVSSRLHRITRVLLVNHTDCGAYGGHAAFESLEAELERHRNDLEKAAALIAGRFPDLMIERYLALVLPDGEGWRVEVRPLDPGPGASETPSTSDKSRCLRAS
ncbi:MAG: hypothetical protein GXP54_12620 [Deltaproteobacteria bacterium]|nr:hypothetical protein [Deltaproteobacteria bacterium]